MIVFSLMERLWAHWQMAQAVKRLDHPSGSVGAYARERLRASGPACWPLLRRVAFRQRALRAILAAELLVEMGDEQGLYALLEQFSNWEMRVHEPLLRRVLIHIGEVRLLNALDIALDQLEQPSLTRQCWSLSLAVYALRALWALQASVPRWVWQRALQIYVPNFEDLRTCRAILPSLAASATQAALPYNYWSVGSTVAAVRRAAVDALLTVNQDDAFDLLREALAHANPQVQLTALYGLTRLGDTRALVLMQPLAADRRHPLCRDARRAIESFGTEQPDVLTLLRGSEPEVAGAQQLLRPAAHTQEQAPETLLRPARKENS